MRRWFAHIDIVTPFDVHSGATGVDYSKIVHKFGCEVITESHIRKVEKLTGSRAHRFLRRGIYFAHRDFDLILNSYEEKKKFYLYTGRGPSSECLHLGHLVPFIFSKWLSDAFDVPIVIMISDDEKYLYRPELTVNEVSRNAKENIKDIIACGFRLEKTFIFKNTDFISHLYPNLLRMQKGITVNQITACFGLSKSDNVGKFAFPPLQAVPAFSNTFPFIFKKDEQVPCLIPEAIDQDPYFRMARDVAPKLGYLKPAVIHAKFFPGLQGLQAKMSGSLQNSAVFLNDSFDVIQSKIRKHAFSGGGKTLAEHKEKGANLDIDVPIQWLGFFMENDDSLEKVKSRYASGEIATSEVKDILIEEIANFLRKFQEKRKNIDDDLVNEYMRIRALQL